MENWKGILLLMFGIIICFFWLIWYINEKSLDYHYTAETPMTIESYCDTIFEMYSYDIENEVYEHQECRLYINQKKICEEEKEIFGEWEWLERCLADLEFNRQNILNLMR